MQRKTESRRLPVIGAQFFAMVKRFAVYLRNGVRSEVRAGQRFAVSLLVVCTFVAMTLLLVLTIISVVFLQEFHLLSRLILFSIIFIYLLAGIIFLKQRHYTVVAGMLIAFYALLASAMLWYWSINTPVGILLLGFAIALVGILLGSRYILPIVGCIIIAMIGIQAAYVAGWVHPNFIALAAPSSFRDVFVYTVIFAIFAVVSWLSRRQTEQSFSAMKQAKRELAKEKELLAVRLEEQTRNLRESQMEETRQLYRFAELGQLSTLLLHELANNLTVLTLDIDNLEQRHRSSTTIKRARESIGYLETMVEQARHQLQDAEESVEIDLSALLHDTIVSLKPKALRAQVKLEYVLSGGKTYSAQGDPLRLTQVLTVLITNAIDAYVGMPLEGRRVLISLHASHKKQVIEISDWGIGIGPKARRQLFQPFKTSKANGMGIGLFIAKSMVESQFHGTLTLKNTAHATTFVVTLPSGVQTFDNK